MKEKNENYTPMLVSACVEVLTLHLLQQKPMYTYDLVSEIERASEGRLSAPKLYNAMVRLKTADLVAESEQKIVGNRVRVYYALTEKGAERLRQSAELLEFLAGALKKTGGEP